MVAFDFETSLTPGKTGTCIDGAPVYRRRFSRCDGGVCQRSKDSRKELGKVGHVYRRTEKDSALLRSGGRIPGCEETHGEGGAVFIFRRTLGAHIVTRKGVCECRLHMVVSSFCCHRSST